jgi:hypothetical protein
MPMDNLPLLGILSFFIGRDHHSIVENTGGIESQILVSDCLKAIIPTIPLDDIPFNIVMRRRDGENLIRLLDMKFGSINKTRDEFYGILKEKLYFLELFRDALLTSKHGWSQLPSYSVLAKKPKGPEEDITFTLLGGYQRSIALIQLFNLRMLTA